jgi:hypothetical protein
MIPKVFCDRKIFRSASNMDSNPVPKNALEHIADPPQAIDSIGYGQVTATALNAYPLLAGRLLES